MIKGTRAKNVICIFMISLFAGCIQFFGQSFLNKTLPVETFSKISFILSQFATYFLLVDLGIQGEIIRLLSRTRAIQERNSLLTSSIYLRIIGAFLALAGMTLHGYLGNLSAGVFLSLLTFGLCLFPAGALLAFEAQGYVNENIFYSSTSRISRALSYIFYLVFVYFFKELTFLLLPLFFVIYSFMTFLAAKKMHYSFSNFFKFKENINSTKKLFSNVLSLNIVFLLGWIFSTSFSVICLKVLGESNLNEINVSFILSIPISLFAQALTQSWLAFHSKNSDRLHFPWKYFLALVTSTVCYFFIVSQEFFIFYLFPQVNYLKLTNYLGPMIFAHGTIAINGFLIMVFQSRDLKRQTIHASVFSIATLLIFGAIVVNHTASQLLGVLFFVGQLSITAYFLFVLFKINYKKPLKGSI